jgi:hypothetical protein
MSRSSRILILIFLALIATSCSIERRLAEKYVRDLQPGAIQVITPELVFKNSFKIPDIENFESYSEAEKDSILLYSSELIQFVDDTIYIKAMLEGLAEGLNSYGYRLTYNRPDEFFLIPEKSSFILNLAQMQLEEFYDSIQGDPTIDYDVPAGFLVYINAVNFNNWIELSNFDDEINPPVVLFNSRKMTDGFKGGYTYFEDTGDISYRYNIDSIEVNDIYTGARRTGQLYSVWLFNSLMNAYVRANMPEGKPVTKSFYYDYKDRLLIRSFGSPFTRMEN